MTLCFGLNALLGSVRQSPRNSGRIRSVSETVACEAVRRTSTLLGMLTLTSEECDPMRLAHDADRVAFFPQLHGLLDLSSMG